ncbi:MAG: alpha/beta fold hydrolase [Proteobacteria bacterium]|nr:alpha/beta fold hydrolase [Pseudomonadota bacterium]
MNVELISVETSDGVTLDGSLRLPATPGSELPVDLVIMHHGIGGNFYRAYFFETMAEQLLARGCAVIRANNRGHDLAYNAPPPFGRLGAAFENVDDCRRDWKAWLDLAEAGGFSQVCVWGHSLGAVKTIYAAAQDNDPRIARLIASSPPRFSYSAYLARADGNLFQASVDEAQALADAGKTDVLFPIQIPTGALMTTKVFFDKYGPEERYDILKHLPSVTTPILVTVGGLEGARPDQVDRFAFEGLSEKISAMAEKQSSLASALINGGNHFYDGCTDALWSSVETWLSQSA